MRAEQTRYKQKFSEEQCSDESLFSISMVPIQITRKITKALHKSYGKMFPHVLQNIVDPSSLYLPRKQ